MCAEIEDIKLNQKVEELTKERDRWMERAMSCIPVKTTEFFHVVQTQYEVNANGYDYKVFFREDSGVIFRRKEGMVDIPPTNEVYTENGWIGVTSNSTPIRHFKYLYEIEEFVKSDI